MFREASVRLFAFCAVCLPVLSLTSSALAGPVINQKTYNSLTAITGNDSNTSPVDVTSNIVSATGYGLQPNKNATSAAAYAYRFGIDGTTDQTVADVGNNTLSTIIVADDLGLFVDTTSQGNANFNQFSINSLRFLVSNANTDALTVNAHIRIYDDNALSPDNPQPNTTGFAGNILGSYDLNGITLNGKGSEFASATQVTVPSSAFSSNPLDIARSQFAQVGTGKYYSRIWVGIFFTADSTTTTTAQLSNVGSVIYDPKAGPIFAPPDYTETTQFDIGTSSDLFEADDISFTKDSNPGNDKNGPQANHPYTGNFDALLYKSIVQSYSLDNNNNGPEANFAWLLGGNVFLMPEPGTFALFALGGIPILKIARRRKS